MNRDSVAQKNTYPGGFKLEVQHFLKGGKVAWESITLTLTFGNER